MHMSVIQFFRACLPDTDDINIKDQRHTGQRMITVNHNPIAIDRLYINDGLGSFSRSLEGLPDLRTSGSRVHAHDFDKDGDQDLLAGVLGGAYNPNTTTVDNFHYVEQVAVDRFDQRTSRFVSTIDVGSESVPSMIKRAGLGAKNPSTAAPAITTPTTTA